VTNLSTEAPRLSWRRLRASFGKVCVQMHLHHTSLLGWCSGLSGRLIRLGRAALELEGCFHSAFLSLRLAVRLPCYWRGFLLCVASTVDVDADGRSLKFSVRRVFVLSLRLPTFFDEHTQATSHALTIVLWYSIGQQYFQFLRSKKLWQEIIAAES